MTSPSSEAGYVTRLRERVDELTDQRDQALIALHLTRDRLDEVRKTAADRSREISRLKVRVESWRERHAVIRTEVKRLREMERWAARLSANRYTTARPDPDFGGSRSGRAERRA